MSVSSRFLVSAAEVVDSNISVNDPSPPRKAEVFRGGWGRKGEICHNGASELLTCSFVKLVMCIVGKCRDLYARVCNGHVLVGDKYR